MTTTTLRQYTIYDHPRDHPDGYVVRAWDIDAGGLTPGTALIADTLDEARALIPEGMFNVGRLAGDDACIVETWT